MKHIEEGRRQDRRVMACLCEVQRAAGNAGMAYLSGSDLDAHIRLMRAELIRLEELTGKRTKPRQAGAQGQD